MISKPKAIDLRGSRILENRVYVALGANLGNREANIMDAIRRIGELALDDVACSSLYESPAEDMDGAPAFINGVVGFTTACTPEALLHALQAIEVAMGRAVDHGRNTSRVIDLDIISYGSREINEPGLVIPHPRAHARGFVLMPLAELDPGLILPGQTVSVAELARSIADLAGRSTIAAEHIAEAIQYRRLDASF